MQQDRRPAVIFSSDADGWTFRRNAVMQVPSMLDLLESSNGIYRDLMVDIRSDFFPQRQERHWEVSVSIGDEQLLRVECWKIYAHHQCIIPLASFNQDITEVQITAAPLDQDKPDTDEAPIFILELAFCDKREIWNAQEKRSIWLFSTARSGSTWLGSDVICWRHRARPVDESGIGRIFAPLSWEAERFFGLQDRYGAFVSGPACETRSGPRREAGVVPFERAFRHLDRENQVLNRMNFDLYHKLLRDCVLEHVLNEWGVRHYNRLVFKMPNDSHAADFIMRAFPRSRMIFLMRDGRDVLRSRFSPFASPTLAESKDAELRRYAISFYAHFWNFQIDIIRSAYEAHDPELRYFVRYEELRSDPMRYIGDLLTRIDMEVSPAELEQLVQDVTLENIAPELRGPAKQRQDGQISGYRKTFSPDEIDLMNSIMGDNLQRYGYTRP
jgi:hypothetical protein